MMRAWMMSIGIAVLSIPASADFHVATIGDDTNPGTAESPFATIGRAQTAVREAISSGLQSDLTVWIHGGNYSLTETLRFIPEDSGTDVFGVSYAGMPDETVLISGGISVADWTSIGNDQWTASIPDAARADRSLRQLFVDDQRLPRGRYPNAPDLLRVETVTDDVKTIAFTSPLTFDNLSDQNAELVMYQNWSISRVGIQSSTDTSVTLSHPMGWIGHGPATTASSDKPAYIEHALAFVDVPGEWYLDYASCILTYQAAPDEDPNQRRFVLPLLEQLVVVEGQTDAPVTDLHFTNLTFAYTHWERPTFGYLGIQAGHYGTTLSEPTHVLPVAIEMTYAQGCSIEGARIEHTGAGGIGIGVGTRHNRVEACELSDIGANGIMVGWRGKGSVTGTVQGGDFHLSGDWTHPEDVPVENVILGNLIQQPGAINHGCVGIFDAFARGTRIAHNVIHDTPYTGISVGFRWNQSETSQRDTHIEYNHVYDTMKMLADGGCLYTLGLQPGTVIRGNVFHNVHRSRYAHGGAPNNGIFFDEGSTGMQVVGNTIYDTSGDPVRFNQTNAGNMTWEDNVFGVGINRQELP